MSGAATGLNERVVHHVSDAMERAGVPWCFLREREHLVGVSGEGSEVDVWCPAEAATRLLPHLVQRRWRVHSGRALSKGPSLVTASVRLRSSLPHDGHRVTLEVTLGALRWRLIPYRTEEAVRRDITGGPVPIAGGATLLSVLITRVLLRGELLDKRLDRARAAWLGASDEARMEWRRAAARVLGARRAASIESALRSGSRPTLSRAARLGAALRVFASEPRLTRNLAKWTRARIRSRFRRDGGLVVSFVGTDGAGKTTTADNVASALEARGSPVHRTYWGRGGRSALVAGLRKRVQAARGEEVPTPASVGGAGDAAATLAPDPDGVTVAATTGALLYLLDYWWCYLTKISPRRRRGEVVLMDRGPVDLKVMYEAHPAARALWRLAPSLDLTIHCVAPADRILERKAERSRSVTERHLRDYEKAVARLLRSGSPACSLPTVDGQEKATKRVLGLVDACVAQREGRLDREILDLMLPWA